MKHIHSVYDTDSHFSISPITRAIKNESSKKTTVMQYDHNSERFTFEMPRYIEGHDMTLCNRVELHYINVASDKSGQSNGVYVINDLQTSPEDESIVICSWLISKKATKYAGTLSFRLRFACIDENAKVVYAWHTEIFKSISVSNGIDNAETVHEEYSDILETWKKEWFDTFEPWKAEIDTTIDALDEKVSNLENESGGSVTVDDALSETSENPVQNAVVTKALDNKVSVLSNAGSGYKIYAAMPNDAGLGLVSAGSGSFSKGVDTGGNKMVALYTSEGILASNDSTGGYAVVNNRILAGKLSALKSELEKELSDIETVLNTLIKYEWLDIFPDNENAQVIVNNAKKYHFRGYADSTFDAAIVSDSYGSEYAAAFVQEAFVATDVEFTFTLDSIPNLEQGDTVSGKLTEFSIPEDAWWDNNVIIKTYEGVGCAVSMHKWYDEENDVYYVDIDATVRFNINADINSEAVNADYTLDVYMWRREAEESDKFAFTKAYVAVNNETADYFPTTMSLREQSINNQIIASLEEAKAKREAARTGETETTEET